jgi:hypothetical protein
MQLQQQLTVVVLHTATVRRRARTALAGFKQLFSCEVEMQLPAATDMKMAKCEHRVSVTKLHSQYLVLKASQHDGPLNLRGLKLI